MRQLLKVLEHLKVNVDGAIFKSLLDLRDHLVLVCAEMSTSKLATFFHNSSAFFKLSGEDLPSFAISSATLQAKLQRSPSLLALDILGLRRSRKQIDVFLFSISWAISLRAGTLFFFCWPAAWRFRRTLNTTQALQSM